MKHFSRPDHRSYRNRYLFIGTALLAAVVALAPQPARAQLSGLAQVLEQPSPAMHSGSQGYMGVLVGDVDTDTAAKLKLKDVRGAVVTLIDHDAPAAQSGIRINDVVLQVNGQGVEGAEAFTRMLREIPAGHKVNLLISRDGTPQTIVVELVDRKKMEHDVWNKLDSGGDPVSSAPGLGILSGGAGDVPSGSFHMPFFGSTLNVGAMVEPLTSQMADYLGIQSGLMVKQVVRKSEAETAGIKAFDIIVKVGAENIATTADWDRALRANQNKPVQVTILRDRKQQTITLQVDSKRHHAELEDFFTDGDCPLMAALDPDVASELGRQLAGDDSAIQSLSESAKARRDEAEALRDQAKGQGFQLDKKQMDELKQQMQQFSQSFKPEDFKLDRKQMDELQQQMQQFDSPEFQKQFRDEMQKQMDRLRRQMEEMQAQGFDHMV
jgi:serine protease Do